MGVEVVYELGPNAQLGILSMELSEAQIFLSSEQFVGNLTLALLGHPCEGQRHWLYIYVGL